MGKKKKSSAIHYLGIFKYTYKHPSIAPLFSLLLFRSPPPLALSLALYVHTCINVI